MTNPFAALHRQVLRVRDDAQFSYDEKPTLGGLEIVDDATAIERYVRFFVHLYERPDRQPTTDTVLRHIGLSAKDEQTS